jgi:hypothetical protein
VNPFGSMSLRLANYWKTVQRQVCQLLNEGVHPSCFLLRSSTPPAYPVFPSTFHLIAR